MKIKGIFATAALLFSGTPIYAQSTSVETLGTITAQQVSNGLGVNLDANQDWQFTAAANMGATHVRFQCAWVTVGQQTPPPSNTAASTPYIQDPNCTAAFASAASRNMHPTVVAAFGAPYHQILTVTIPAGASIGATSLAIVFSSGVGGDTLANLAFPYDYIQGPPHVAPTYGVLSNAGSYQGDLITGVTLTDSTHATITLASALNVALPANSTAYTINEILYPSAATTSPTDPSVVAYGNYVSFLASDIAAHGLSGEVEIWNEPPWTPDPWDNRLALYDSSLAPAAPSPGPTDSGQPNYGFAANLQNKAFPAGVTLVWNGTSGNGEASLLNTLFSSETGGTMLKQPSTVITSESFHPYGYEPEQLNWTTSCLEATAAPGTYGTYPGGVFTGCYLPGEPTGSNIMAAVQFDMAAKYANPAFGIAHEITETGILPPAAGYQVGQARFNMRQFLTYQADGVTPVEFFKLYDASTLTDPNFSFVEEVGSTSSYTPNPSYTALAGFMADLKPIANAPATTYTSATLPSVTSYSGTFPLSTAHMVGARGGASHNSDMFVLWQRSYAASSWITMASPAPGTATVLLPSGTSLNTLRDSVTRATVSYTTAGASITFPVADNPIEMLVDPSSTGTVAGTTITGLLKSGSVIR